MFAGESRFGYIFDTCFTEIVYEFTVAGLPADKMVEAHGTFSDATCLLCRQRHDKEDIKVIQLYSVTRS